MKWFSLSFCVVLLSAYVIPVDEEMTIKSEINGKTFDILKADNTIPVGMLKDSVRINLKVFLDGEDASTTTYIFTYEVKLKRGEKTLYQMNFKRGQEYVFFTETARMMLQPGDAIQFKMSNFTFEDESGVHTQMLPSDMRTLIVSVSE